MRTATFPLSGRGEHNFSFVVGDECEHGCSAMLVVNSASASRAPLVPGVVASKVYDMTLPETQVVPLTLDLTAGCCEKGPVGQVGIGDTID